MTKKANLIVSYYWVGRERANIQWTDNDHFVLFNAAPPKPHRFVSTVSNYWRGGFVGHIHVPVSEHYNSWKIIMKFPRKVFKIYVSIFLFQELSGFHLYI